MGFDQSVNGQVIFVEDEPQGERLWISGKIYNLSPGPHGFHIHSGHVSLPEKMANCRLDCSKACAHLEKSAHSQNR